MLSHRKCCGGDLDFARSLCRCRKWHSSGGKSNVFFAKTLDDRFVIKQVTRTELLSFLEFGPDYFKYLADALSTGAPTCLAKTLGIYQVSTGAVQGSKMVAQSSSSSRLELAESSICPAFFSGERD